MLLLLVIEYTKALRNELSWSGWSGWSWQIQGRQPPWHALRVLLREIYTYHWAKI